MIKKFLLGLAAAALVFSCDVSFSVRDSGGNDDGDGTGQQVDDGGSVELPDDTTDDNPGGYDWTGVKYTFREAEAPVVNPERGFYYPVDLRSGTSPISVSSVKAQRKEGRTLFYLGFYLNDFMEGNGDISSDFLKKIQDCMDALREGGAKCILRFAYKDRESDKPWDASEKTVLHQVEQLKPLLQKNEDVIFVLQAGFVGVWGEWYYTDNFVFQPSSDADYQPRRHLADALLDALPASRKIQVRTPQFKMRMYGLSVKDTLTYATANKGTALSRIGGHNDCFGASSEDWGTFDNEPSDRAFWKAETRYTVMGGETCNVSDYCTCEASLKDMADYHWTYLNIGYHGGVIDRWKSTGCFDEIVDRLGYRLVLDNVERKEEVDDEGNTSIAINFRNTGFASPVNPRKVELVFVDESGSATIFDVPSDPRKWHCGAHTVLVDVKLPSEKGTLYMNLPDPLLYNRPEYSIAFANEDVFDSKTGYNKLFEL